MMPNVVRHLAALTAWLLLAAIVPAGRGVAAEPASPASQPDQPARTALVYGDIYLEHKTPPGHIENPARLRAIIQRLTDVGLMDRLVLLPPRDASVEWLATVHSAEYIAKIRARSVATAALSSPNSAEQPLDSEAPVSGRSCQDRRARRTQGP